MTFRLANVEGRAALVLGTGLYDLHRHSDGRIGPDPMAAVIRFAELGEIAASLEGTDADAAFDPERLHPPVPRPQKVIGIGLNYRDHAAEAGLDLPTSPLVFAKFPSCLVGPEHDITLAGSRDDWEAELVVVIGKGGHRIPAAKAWSHVAGLTVGQDISARDVQFAVPPPQFTLGKSYDTYGPVGPVMVSVDAFEHPEDLAISCDVNGVRRQTSRTSEMIFSVPELIEHLSSVMTLVPGDLIFTGTPAGVGSASNEYLKPGDVITTTIEGIGTLTNRCVSPC
ncbi:MAG: fumarylacetoacetate hydrolase family protein [Actinomycetota bacterium]|nr:fumarylacetoacetate hydrolase family protein [Actinomycetota bacterium]